MAGWRPLKRRDFIRKLRALGFDGPYSGTRHQFMILGQHRQTIPTNSEYSVPQIRHAPPASRIHSGTPGLPGGMEFVVTRIFGREEA